MKSNRLATFIRVVLIIWGIVPLIGLIFFEDYFKSAPTWELITIAGSAMVGLAVFCFFFMGKPNK